MGEGPQGRDGELIRLHRDRLSGQPEERQHSAAIGGTRDRLPPARCVKTGAPPPRAGYRVQGFFSLVLREHLFHHFGDFRSDG